MAKELLAPTDGRTGLTTYVVMYDATGQVRSGDGSFAVASAVNRNAGGIDAAELGTAPGVYAADAPVGLAAGWYLYLLCHRVGVSRAETDPLLCVCELDWGGSARVPLSSRLATAGYTAPPTTAQVADKVLGRSLAGGADGGRTVAQALAASRNRVAFDVPAAGTFTVFDVDDVTPLWVGTYARGANTLGPLTATDPTG